MLKQEVWEKAKKVTSYFEGWLAGNFDGQGLSYGYLQWNFGQCTLQPLFLRLFNEFPDVAARVLPSEGRWLKAAITDGWVMKWALQIQSENKIQNPWRSALEELYYTPEWQQIMDDAAILYKDKAIKMCNEFGFTTERAFCLAFDIAVQNGGLKHYEMIETEYIDKLKSWAEVAALSSNTKWQNDVRSRKMAIVYGCNQGRGWPDVELTDEPAFEDEIKVDQELKQALEILKSKITIDPTYWLSNAVSGKQCDGALVNIIFKRFAEQIRKVG